MANDLREFLTSRRAALSPDQVGLPVPATARRVKGLRREEVAILAGVSIDYYVKLEQGRAGNVSGQVIDAVARALRLDEVETRYLRSLLHPGSAPDLVKARPAQLSMIDAMEVPAVIHGPLLEVLGLNHAARTLLDGLETHRSYARWLFLDPRARAVYRDWADVAADVVALLRAAPADQRRTLLVGELATGSDEFARMWADYRLSDHRHGVKHFFHEAVGDMRLNWQTLHLPDSHGQSIVVYSADTGSPSEEKLRLLNSWTAVPYAASPPTQASGNTGP